MSTGHALEQRPQPVQHIQKDAQHIRKFMHYPLAPALDCTALGYVLMYGG